MATLEDRLEKLYDRGLKEGVDTLSPEEQRLYLIYDFIIEYEMNDLSGYFYNRFPEIVRITAAIKAMRQCGLKQLPDLLDEAVSLFHSHAELSHHTTWGKVLEAVDPSNRLQGISHQISQLKNYALDEINVA